MHPDEIDIDDALVRRLITRDMPALRDRPLRRLAASGSTNAMFRLGDDHLVRLPLQPGGSSAIETEARWLPLLAPELPVAVPDVVAVGNPGFGYPERWAVANWLAGEPPATPCPDGADANQFAGDLAAFVAALRAVEVSDDAAGDPALRWYRSRPLQDIDEDIRHCLDDCRHLADLPLDIDACSAVWAEAVELPSSDGPMQWAHADLLAENLLLNDGRLAAVLDFGGVTVGDSCVDLVVAWEVLGPGARDVFRARLDVDDTTWLRGRGWALAIAVMTFPYYWTSMPERCAARLAMAQQVLADAAARP